MSGRYPALGVSLLLSTATGTQAAAPVWTLATDSPIVFQQMTRDGILVVSTERELLGVDMASGQVRWKRGDLPNTSEAPGEAAPSGGMGGPARPTNPIPRLTLEPIGGSSLGLITRDSAAIRASMEAFDLRTGERRWHSSALPVRDTRGSLPLAGQHLILIYGVAAEAGPTRMVLLGVDLESGALRWRQDALFTQRAAEYAVPGDGYETSRGTITPNQPPLLDSDSTAILFISPEGPVKIDLRTGQKLWSAALSAKEPPASIRGYARMLLHDGWIYLPFGKSLQAVRARDGQSRWSRPIGFPTKVGQMEMTRAGLLVRCDPDRNEQRRQVGGKPCLALVAAETGELLWKEPLPNLKDAGPFRTDGQSVYLATRERLYRFELETGKVKELASLEFQGGEWPTAMELREGAISFRSAQNLWAFDTSGTLRYSTYVPAPSSGLFGKILGFVLFGYSAVGDSSMGYFFRYKATTQSAGYAYLVSKEVTTPEGSTPGLVKIDLGTGKEAGQIPVGEKRIDYQLDPERGLVSIRRGERGIEAYAM